MGNPLISNYSQPPNSWYSFNMNVNPMAVNLKNNTAVNSNNNKKQGLLKFHF